MQVPWTVLTANPSTSELFVELFYSHCDYHVAWLEILEDMPTGIAMLAIVKGSHVETTYVSGKKKE